MAAVAERTVMTVFAATEIDWTILFRRVGSRRKTRSLVGAIAEGLRGTPTAGTPVVGLACFNGDGNGGFLGDHGFGHGRER